jgi:hypothetical protein
MMRHDLNRRKQAELALRLRQIRKDLYGDDGAQLLADALEIQVGTWLNYERGVTMPGLVVLKLIDIARVNPHWLLTGQGDPQDDRKRHFGACRSLF